MDEDNSIVKHSEQDVIHQMPPHVASAFEVYYNIEGKRSFPELIKLLHPDNGWPYPQPTLSQLRHWSHDHRWQDIIKTRDGVEYELIRAEIQKDLAVRAKARLEAARKMMKAGQTIMDKADLQALDAQSARYLLGTAKALMELSMKAERLELGETSDNYAAPKPPSEMTDEELEAHIAKLEKDDD